MPTEEQWQTMEEAEAALTSLKKLRNIISRMDLRMKIFEEWCKLNRPETALNDEDYAFTFRRHLKEISTELLGRFSEFYAAFEESPYNIAERSAEQEAASKSDSLGLAVKLAVCGSTLIIRTPHLLNRNVTFHQTAGRQVSQEYHKFFASEINKKLDSFQSKLPRYLYKNISVFSCYRPGGRRLPDAENLDSKCIVDAILHRFPGSDGGKYCSFYQLCFYDATLDAYSAHQRQLVRS